MATAYGGWVATDDFRAKLVYSSTSSNTATTVSATLYIEANAGWSNNGSGSLTIKNGSTTIGSASGSGKAFSANSTVTVCSKSVSVNRTTSDQSITISCSVGASYTSSTSSKTVTITVPKLASYSITPNANGGTLKSGCTTLTKTYGVTKAIWASSLNPTRTGYTFSKWNTQSNGSGTNYSAGANYTANASATLYAQWNIITYTIQYNANGGSGAPANQTKTYGKTLTLSSTKPTRTGYTFKGWATTSNATSATYSAGGSYTANSAATLYAVWSIITYSITPNANGGTLKSGCSTLTKNYGTAINIWASSLNPTRTGYNFVKWNTKADGTGTDYSAGGSYATNAAATLYAQWTPITYTVTYNANTGNDNSIPASQTKIYGTTLTLSSTIPTKDGYTFLEWNTDSNGTGVTYAAESSYTADAAVTLYAIWRADAPKITIKQCYRSDSTGTIDDEGTYLYLQYNFTQTMPSNIRSSLYINESNNPSYLTSLSPSSSGNYPLQGTTNILYNAHLSQDLSYAIELRVSNDYGTTIINTHLGTAYYPIDAKVGGTGIAFGKAATQEGILDSAFPMKVTVKENDVGITIKHPAILLSNAEPPETNKEIVLIDCLDSSDVSRNKLEVVDCADDRQGIRLKTKRTINDIDVENALYLSVDAEGNQKVNVTNSPAFRNGIGASNGVWPISMGGTGLSSSPSMLTNLGSTTAADVLAASPRPGITGTLGAANGGTGQTSLKATRNAMGLGNTTGALPAANGGTGNTSLQATRNAMGLGNTTGALPIANGGTGKTTAADARSALGAAHNVWTSLGSVTGTTSLTLDLTSYNEVLITARYSSSYLSSVVLPKTGIHASTLWEIYLGGWGKDGSTSNRRAVAEISRVKFTPIAVTIDNVERTSSATWVVYAR